MVWTVANMEASESTYPHDASLHCRDLELAKTAHELKTHDNPEALNGKPKGPDCSHQHRKWINVPLFVVVGLRLRQLVTVHRQYTVPKSTHFNLHTFEPLLSHIYSSG